MPPYRELALALSYGRNSKSLSKDQLTELSQIENLIAGADSDEEVVNSLRIWAQVATTPAFVRTTVF